MPMGISAEGCGVNPKKRLIEYTEAPPPLPLSPLRCCYLRDTELRKMAYILCADAILSGEGKGKTHWFLILKFLCVMWFACRKHVPLPFVPTTLGVSVLLETPEFVSILAIMPTVPSHVSKANISFLSLEGLSQERKGDYR